MFEISEHYFKVYLKSSNITRYFLTKIGHLLDVEINLKVDLKKAFSKYQFHKGCLQKKKIDHILFS